MKSKFHFLFDHHSTLWHGRRFMRFEHDHGHHGRGGRRGGRRLEHGDLRLLALSLINDSPRHGYELIKAIEDLTGGLYAPSPGVIYPTLTWLEELGHVSVTPEGSKRLFHITNSGKLFLEESRGALDSMFSRLHQGPTREAIMPVKRAVENLRMALRMKLDNRKDPEIFHKVTGMIDELVQQIERL